MRRSKPMKRTAMRRSRRRDGAMPQDVYLAVMNRSQGRCEANLPGICTKQATDWHHRQRRQRGNDVITNGAALCRECHHHITFVSPEVGRLRGLIVHSHHPNPAEVPMLVGNRWCVLLPDGGLQETKDVA